MSSNKELSPPLKAFFGFRANPGEVKRRRIPAAMMLIALVALLPFGTWLVGSGIVMVTPPVYRSEAVVRVDADASGRSASETSAKLRSAEVVAQAARTLGKSQGDDPTSTYLLWSSLSVEAGGAPHLLKLEARGSKPAEARRIVEAVVDAYEKQVLPAPPAPGESRALVYLSPQEIEPTRVSDETRMMLGISGFASLCLLLCVPFFRLTEEKLFPNLRTAGA